MPYAVVQKSLEPPSREQLENAFHGIPGLAKVDAIILGRDAFGILVKGFSLERATMLQTSLASQGVETEVVDEAELPPLPQFKNVNRLECTPEALVIYDPLNRSFSLEWKNVMLIAAGRVPMSEFKRVRTEAEAPAYDLSNLDRGYRQQPKILVDYSSHEERHERLMLEIVLTRAVLRYSITADKVAHLLFQYLGERRTRDVLQNFTLLVQDLTKYAPQATVNRGAHFFRENATEPFPYPSKNAFYEEIIWLLWKLKRASEPR
ncbi:MAG: hypothetical protein JWQ71_4016 [Pedosphaera sp.]|nr:hypothetical protein [Pedosphaera sp.]